PRAVVYGGGQVNQLSGALLFELKRRFRHRGEIYDLIEVNFDRGHAGPLRRTAVDYDILADDAWRRRRRRLYFKCTDVGSAANNAGEPGAAWTEHEFGGFRADVHRRAAGHEGMGQRRPAIVSERVEKWIDADIRIGERVTREGAD